MNVGEATFTTMTDLVFSTLFSINLSTDSIGNKELKEHVNGITRYIGTPNISDFYPILAPLDLQGIRRKIGYHLGSLMGLVNGLIEKRMRQRMDSDYKKMNDFLDTLLEQTHYEFTIKEMINLCVVSIYIYNTKVLFHVNIFIFTSNYYLIYFYPRI